MISVKLTEMGTKRVVGLDIGTEYLKAVEVEKRIGGFRVVGADFLKLPVGAEKEKIISDELRLLWIRGRFSKREIITNLQLPEIVVKRIITEKDISSDRIKWEAAAYFPFNSSSVVIDTYITNPSIPPRYQEMVLVAVPKEVIDDRMEFLKGAGLTASSITPSSVALSNLLELIYPKLEEAIIIHIGFKNTLFIVYKDKRLILAHSILFGIKDVIDTIQKGEDIDYLTAWERVKEDTPSIKMGSKRLSSEIKKSHSLLSKSLHGAKVLLSGGGALINNLTKNLNMEFETLKVETLSPLYNVALGLCIGVLYD